MGPYPEKPDGPITPLTKDDVLDLLDHVEDFASAVQGAFVDLNKKADSITGTEAELTELGEHVGGLIHGLETVAGPEGDRLAGKWVKNMVKLVYAGVEDQGQCHKVLGMLMKMEKDAERKDGAGKRQMSDEELAFWQMVAKSGKEEVACIVDRFDEFLGMVRHVSDAIRNPPAGYNENGHAFEAEVLMGSLYFGYGHLYRQVAVFAHVMHALMNYEQKDEARAKGQNKLRALLEQAELITRKMDEMKAFRRLQ